MACRPKHHSLIELAIGTAFVYYEAILSYSIGPRCVHGVKISYTPTGRPQKLHIFSYRDAFIKYWSIFKLISLWESGENVQW